MPVKVKGDAFGAIRRRTSGDSRVVSRGGACRGSAKRSGSLSSAMQSAPSPPCDVRSPCHDIPPRIRREGDRFRSHWRPHDRRPRRHACCDFVACPPKRSASARRRARIRGCAGARGLGQGPGPLLSRADDPANAGRAGARGRLRRASRRRGRGPLSRRGPVSAPRSSPAHLPARPIWPARPGATSPGSLPQPR